MGTRKTSAAEEPRRRKRYHLPQDKIDDAKAILGTKTDSETIERALEIVAFQKEMLDAVDAMHGAGVVNVFDEAPGAEVHR
jgi:hypothetical protein